MVSYHRHTKYTKFAFEVEPKYDYETKTIFVKIILRSLKLVLYLRKIKFQQNMAICLRLTVTMTF